MVGRFDSAPVVARNNEHMADQWSQTVVVSGITGEPAYTLFCEPEGATHEVQPGDALTITFSADRPHGIEMSSVRGGIALCRLGDSDVTISDKRGRDLHW
jgi:hypothetical protein